MPCKYASTSGPEAAHRPRATHPRRRRIGCIAIWAPLIVVLGCNRTPSELSPQRPTPSWAGAPSLTSVALADPGDAPPGPLFEPMTSAATGVSFVSAWTPDPASDDAQRLDSHYTGGGVAIGDYDGDELPDLMLTRPFGGGRLYRNRGNFQFEDATAAANLTAELDGDSWGSGVTFADIDNDGDLDLYVCQFDRPNRLYVNQGDGTFQEQAARRGVDFRGGSVVMAMADYDLDGDLDGYLLTNRVYRQRFLSGRLTPVVRNGRLRPPDHLVGQVEIVSKPDGDYKIVVAGQVDRLYRNDGLGNFVDVSRAALGDVHDGGHMGLAVRWWDFNDDRYPDLYVANDFWGPDYLLRNNGDGAFTDVAREKLPHTPWYSMGCDAGDLNNDGRIDLIASDMSATSHYKAKLNMGDMSDDGWFLEAAEPRQAMRNAVYLNTGGRFLEAAHLLGLDSTDWTWAVKCSDFDNDGRVDVFFSNGMTRNWFNSDFRRPQGGAWREEYADLWQQRPPLAEENLAFRNLGGLRFASNADAWGLDHRGVTFATAVGDLDRDGWLDLVMIDFDGPVRIYRNKGGQSSAGRPQNRIVVELQGVESNSRGVGAVVEAANGAAIHTRDVKTSSGFKSSDDPAVHIGLGDARTIERLTVRWPSGHRQQFVDLPSNRRYTVTEPVGPPSPAQPANDKSSSRPAPMFRPVRPLEFARHKEQPYDDFARQPLLPQKHSQLGPGIACADLNHDGRDDFYLAGAAGEHGKLWVSQPDSRWRLAANLRPADKQQEEMAPLLIDVDGDDRVDLFVVHGGVECEPDDGLLQDRLWMGRGDDFVRAPDDRFPKILVSGSVAAAADYDRDGDLDLFVGGRVVPGRFPETPVSGLYENDAGRFREVAAEHAPGLAHAGMVTSALWSDADDDGWIDLLVTYDWGPVRLWQNKQGRLVDQTQRAGLADRQGWWNGIAGRDFDGDGDIDYVVANVGWNTKYQATREQPIVLYYAEIPDTGAKRILEAKVEGERLLPLRGKSCSTAAIPALAEKFATYEAFARASLVDLYTESCLADAERLEANELATGVLINDGDARFAFHPLPPLAQVAPAYGVVATDLNADGAADIGLAQNFYGPQRETGRMDGGVGLILLGDGQGAFEPVWSERSGVEVIGDGVALATTDLNNDQRPDLLFTRNDDTVVALENECREAASLTIRLRGPVGNRSAVGARVTVAPQQGPVQTAEVAAGGGYLSQSTRDLFFSRQAPTDVVEIRVRWPNGVESTHTPGDASLVEITQ